jgi:multiple sugar transport system substrate-binding protein
VAAAAAVAGCGGGSSDDSGSAESVGKITGPAASEVAPWAASGKAPKTTITVCFFGGPELATMRELGTQFLPYTKNKISLNYVEFPSAQFLEGTLTQLRSKSSKCDLVDDSSSTRSLVEPYLEPLEPFMKQPGLFNAEAYDLNDFPKSILDLAKTTGKGLMSLPLATDAQLLYYRKDLMKKWGIDVPVPPKAWTWDQLYDAVRTIQSKLKAEGNTKMWPIAISGIKTLEGGIFSLLGMWSTGGDPFASKDPNFRDPKVLAGLKRWTGLSTDLKATSPGTPNYAYSELLTALQQEKTAMAVEWNAAAGTLEDPKQAPKTAGKLGYALFPYEASAGADQPRIFPTTHTLGINKASKHKKEAFSFAVWYTSKEMARKYVGDSSGSSGRNSVLTDPEIVKKRPELSTLGYSLQISHGLPNLPSLADLLGNVVSPQVNAVFVGSKSAEDAIAGMQTGSENMLKKSGR